VLDRRAEAPAASLADESATVDVAKDPDAARRLMAGCDAVLPANEDMGCLIATDRVCREAGLPLLFDLDAYRLSSSKEDSNRLFRSMGAPAPGDWPSCGFPVVVKPSGMSGSVGVTKAADEAELASAVRAVEAMGDAAVVQEWVEGPNISIEVVSDGREAVPLVLTEVVLDGHYDCRMVKCPLEGVGRDVAAGFAEWSGRIAERMGLKGLMDVEAIVHGGAAKILEIDARIPSQTPAAVLAATGVNILEALARTVLDGKTFRPAPREGAAVYEHVRVEDGVMRPTGEGGVADMMRPTSSQGLFGWDEIITDHRPGSRSWRATVICSGPTPEKAWSKRNACMARMAEETGARGLESMGAPL